MIEFIDSNKNNYDIKAMYTVLGVARSTYYKSFDKRINTFMNDMNELVASFAYYKVNNTKTI